MNAFVEHHRESIRFQYSCFDRILFNAIIQPLQRPPVIVGFLDQYRHVPSLTRQYFRQVSENYHRWAEKLAAAARTRIVEPPKGVRREQWVEPFYRRLRAEAGIAVILKSRENARVAVSFATRTGGNRIEVYSRFVWQYYFYVRDREFGRMFLRVCPYFPFNARVCINGHDGWPARCGAKGSRFAKRATPSWRARTPNASSNSPMPCRQRISGPVPSGGWSGWCPSSLPTSAAGAGVGTACSSVKSSTAPISSSFAGPSS
jgi:hypothetical protein